LGTGTEKVAKELKALLPKARIARLDRDAVLSRENLFATYRALLDGEVDFLVGTQMIAKGWDLPGLALVGIISTDPGMHLPEYLSSERTFSLISQVVGRAGRREKIGRVIVQTTTPQSPLIKLAIQQDFKTFFKREIETRRQFKWPPFSQIVRLLSEQKNRAKAEAKIKKIEEGLRLLGDKEIIEITASPCFLEKLGGKYRYHIIIKTRKLSDKLYRFLSKLIPDLTIDVDPISLL